MLCIKQWTLSNIYAKLLMKSEILLKKGLLLIQCNLICGWEYLASYTLINETLSNLFSMQIGILILQVQCFMIDDKGNMTNKPIGFAF